MNDSKRTRWPSHEEPPTHPRPEGPSIMQIVEHLEVFTLRPIAGVIAQYICHGPESICWSLVHGTAPQELKKLGFPIASVLENENLDILLSFRGIDPRAFINLFKILSNILRGKCSPKLIQFICHLGEPKILRRTLAPNFTIQGSDLISATIAAIEAPNSAKLLTLLRPHANYSATDRGRPSAFAFAAADGACRIGNAEALRVLRTDFNVTREAITFSNKNSILAVVRSRSVAALEELKHGFDVSKIDVCAFSNLAVKIATKNDDPAMLKALRVLFKLSADDARQSGSLRIATLHGYRDCITELQRFGLTNDDLEKSDEFAFCVASTLRARSEAAPASRGGLALGRRRRNK